MVSGVRVRVSVRIRISKVGVEVMVIGSVAQTSVAQIVCRPKACTPLLF